MNIMNSRAPFGNHYRVYTIMVLALLGVMGPFLSVALAAPIIMSPDPVFDFGDRDNDGEVSHAFVVKNAGDEPLEISDVKTSCGCTVAELETRTLAPGEETKINATFNLKGKQGVQSKKITILSNDPAQASYHLEMKGNAISTIIMEPTIINLGRIEDSASHRGSVVIRSAKEGHTFTIEKITVDDAVPFTTELETVAPGKEYKLTAITNANMMPGSVNGRVTIMTDDPDRRLLSLNVFGHVVGALQIRPDVVRIQENSAPNARPASQYLQVLPGRTKEFELLEIIAPVEGMEAELIQRKENDYHIKLTQMPVDKSLEGKELIVRTNIPEMPEIRIPFEVRPETLNTVGRIPARAPGAVQRAASTPPQPPQRPTAAQQP